MSEQKDKSIHFLYLSQEDCIKAGALDMKETLKAVEESFILHGNDDFVQPPKPVIRWGGPETEETRGRIMSMPSYLGGNKNVAGIKWIPSMPDNPKKYGQPRANALIILSDPDNGFPLAVMDGTIVSAMRTGAATGVAAKYLANPDSEIIGLVGAGVQSRTQLLALNEVFKNRITLVKVFDLDEEKTERFAYEMGEELDLKIMPVKSAEDAIRSSDIFVTATMSTFSYVKGEWVKDGAFHSEISFWDTDPQELIHYDKLVVDDWYQVKHHGVDVTYRSTEKGLIKEENIKELGKIIIGKAEGRQNGKEKILFNPIGISMNDISEAYRIYSNAVAQGIGQQLTLWNSPYWI